MGVETGRIKITMSNKSVGYIQQMDDGDAALDWKSPLRRLSRWVTRNPLINELDFFSLDVKFLLRGEETFRTVFAGLVGMLLYLVTAVITYYVAWPTAFTSRILETQLYKATTAVDHSIFDNNALPIAIRINPLYSPTFDPPPEFKIRFFEVQSNGKVREVPSSQDCPNEAQYCLADKGVRAEIFGGRDQS